MVEYGGDITFVQFCHSRSSFKISDGNFRICLAIDGSQFDVHFNFKFICFHPPYFRFPIRSAESYTSAVEETVATTSETAARLGKAILLYTEPEQVRSTKFSNLAL